MKSKIIISSWSPFSYNRLLQYNLIFLTEVIDAIEIVRIVINLLQDNKSLPCLFIPCREGLLITFGMQLTAHFISEARIAVTVTSNRYCNCLGINARKPSLSSVSFFPIIFSLFSYRMFNFFRTASKVRVIAQYSVHKFKV